MNAPLLVELRTEELPPKALQRLSEVFTAALVKGLRDHHLIAETAASPADATADADADAPSAPSAPSASSFPSASSVNAPAVQGFATPRRLAVLVPAVAAAAPDREQVVRGPSLAVGLDAEGQPTLALRKWAERQGVGLDALTRAGEGKQAAFQARITVTGARLEATIGAIIEAALAALPIPKMMSYQLADGQTTVSFVRPAQGLVVLHGDQVLPADLLGLKSQRQTLGHRFLATAPVTLATATDYEAALEREGHVLPSFTKRRDAIDRLLRDEAGKLDARLVHGQAIDDDQYQALVDEVAALVEVPAVYVGQFDARFLEVPPECLILTMRTNQRVFPLFDAAGRLQPRFLIVSNLPIDDPSNIIDGNERVVRPRLADARFFYEQDRKQTLASRIPRLADVTYHAKLGSQAERARRVAAIGAAVLAALETAPGATGAGAVTGTGADVGTGADAGTGAGTAGDAARAADVERAAQLAKTDLLTDMVGEFPELQGIMGAYYARHDGEPDSVAAAIVEHYQPRFAGDALPATGTGRVLALADKLETLAGIWGIGQHPTGDKDPFALRRHALGVVRLLYERRLPLSLDRLLVDSFAAFASITAVDADVAGLRQFIADRLKGYLRDQGFRAEDVDAVIAGGADRLDRIGARLEAVAAFRERPEFDALTAANKRAANILRKSGRGAPTVEPDRLVEPAEQALHQSLTATRQRLTPLLAALDYGGALDSLAALREPVDAFFDTVLVNAEDAALRDNRLALLASLHEAMNQVADLARL